MKKWVVTFATVMALGAGAWGYIWWHSAASTTVSTLGQNRPGVLGGETKFQDWQTMFFQTRYPGYMKVIRSNEVAQGATVGQYLIGAVSISQDSQLAVTVGRLEGGSIRELSDIKLRRTQTSSYQPEYRSFAPAGSLVFSRVDGYETGIFWEDRGYYTEVVASGSPMHRANLETALELLVTNWQWKR